LLEAFKQLAARDRAPCTPHSIVFLRLVIIGWVHCHLQILHLHALRTCHQLQIAYTASFNSVLNTSY
jgi:hypothetical protein